MSTNQSEYIRVSTSLCSDDPSDLTGGSFQDALIGAQVCLGLPTINRSIMTTTTSHAVQNVAPFLFNGCVKLLDAGRN